MDDFQEKFISAIKKYEEDNAYGVSLIPNHAHTGVDSPLIDYNTLLNKPAPVVVSDASTTVKGITKLSVAPALATSPIAVGANDWASATNYGISKLSVAPASSTAPIAVGDNDTRIPTAAQIAAMAGTSGTPGSTNKFATENDSSNGVTYTASTLSFTASTKTIADSANGFVTANFRAGDSITVTGSASNNGTYTLVSVAAGSIVVVEALVDEAAGASVTMTSVTANKLIRANSSGKLPFAFYSTSYNGTTTKNAADASTTQTIAHGMGVKPAFVQIIARSGATSAGATFESISVYNGTTQSSNSTYGNGGGFTNDNTFSLNTANTNTSQTGVITFDTTNITITWTKNGNPSGTYNLLVFAFPPVI